MNTTEEQYKIFINSIKYRTIQEIQKECETAICKAHFKLMVHNIRLDPITITVLNINSHKD